MENLTESYKNAYLFRLGTTSFIYPDLYSENVNRLGPYLDEIELLLFESREEGSLPDEYELTSLCELKDELNVQYNIHMPTDVDLSSPHEGERSLAVSTYYKVFDLARPLDPTTLTLHIPYETSKHGKEDFWLTNAAKGLSDLLETGIDSRLISVETLDYPIGRLAPLIEEFDLSVCLDVGHVIIHGWDPLEVYKKFKDRISIIHLHGVHEGCDHVSLDLMDLYHFGMVRTMLEDFTGTLSLEVFSFEKLQRSLTFLKKTL